eukprot:COSAG01_NODE_2425_length_7679_cov_96.031221_6_plen_225_part_00
MSWQRPNLCSPRVGRSAGRPQRCARGYRWQRPWLHGLVGWVTTTTGCGVLALCPSLRWSNQYRPIPLTWWQRVEPTPCPMSVGDSARQMMSVPWRAGWKGTTWRHAARQASATRCARLVCLPRSGCGSCQPCWGAASASPRAARPAALGAQAATKLGAARCRRLLVRGHRPAHAPPARSQMWAAHATSRIDGEAATVGRVHLRRATCAYLWATCAYLWATCAYL